MWVNNVGEPKQNCPAHTRHCNLWLTISYIQKCSSKKLHDTRKPEIQPQINCSLDQGHKRSEKICECSLQFRECWARAARSRRPRRRALLTPQPAGRCKKIQSITQIPYQLARFTRRRSGAHNNSGRRSGGGHDGTKGVCAAPPPSRAYVSRPSSEAQAAAARTAVRRPGSGEVAGRSAPPPRRRPAPRTRTARLRSLG